MKKKFNTKELEIINNFLIENNVLQQLNEVFKSNNMEFEVGSIKISKAIPVVNNIVGDCPDGYTKKPYCTPYGQCSYTCVKNKDQ